MSSVGGGTSYNPSGVGAERYVADKRQIAGLLMVSGFCALIQPLFSTAAAIDGATGTTKTTGIPFAALIGGLCVSTTGVLSMFVGYMELVHDWGKKLLTGLLVVFVQTAWIPYISNMTGVGRAISGPGFVPAGYQPTLQDNQFIGAMGIMGILSYGFGLVGTVAFLQFSLYAYQAGKPQDRSASYYRGRMTTYSFMLFLAGTSQFLLGLYIYITFGGTLDKGPIQVAFYLVHLPRIPMVVGSLQICNGFWGVFRSLGCSASGPNSNYFQYSLGFVWFVQLATQIMTQASWGEGPAGAGIAPTVAAFSFGLTLMPAYLDIKSRTTPDPIKHDYYGTSSEEQPR